MGETNFISGKVRASNYGCEVETTLGLFTAALPAGSSRLPVGSECVLSIRPESWQLSTTAPKVNAVSGRIEHCTYLGEAAQYRFAAAGGTLKIYELNPRFVDHDCDREVFASVSPEDVVVLPR